MRLNSIRFKTSILYTVILGIILSIYSGIIYYEVSSMLYRDLDESLQIKANEVAGIIHAYEQSEKLENHPVNILSEFLNNTSSAAREKVIDDLWYAQVKTLNLKNDYIHVLTSAGRLILSSGNAKDEKGEIFIKQFPFTADRIVFQDMKDDKHHLRAINFPVIYNNNPQLIVQIATPLAFIAKTLKKLTMFMFLAIGFVLILTSFLGGVFAKGVLTPVKGIAEAARNISHKDLHIRVEEKQTDEEVGYLVNSFNSMLDRLEESFTHINEFSSHVAHELKTPLAILRGEMELALSGNPTKEELQKVLSTGMEEVNRIIRIIKDLLLLANLDYRTDIFKFEKFDLCHFIADISQDGKILAKEKDIDVTSNIQSTALIIEGDKVHLRRLFFNLLHNAIKFTPEKGKIMINVEQRNQWAAMIIADTGIGISPEDMKKIFDKFYRAGSKDQKNAEPGNGLGLSISQAIAKVHQGDIVVESVIDQGTTFTITLPLV